LVPVPGRPTSDVPAVLAKPGIYLRQVLSLHYPSALYRVHLLQGTRQSPGPSEPDDGHLHVLDYLPQLGAANDAVLRHPEISL
jgi:hypothetical protein